MSISKENLEIKRRILELEQKIEDMHLAFPFNMMEEGVMVLWDLAGALGFPLSKDRPTKAFHAM